MPRVALFPTGDHLLEAATAVHDRGMRDFTLISPVPLEGYEDALGEQRSPVKYFSFFGGVLGAIAGFSLAAGTAIAYPIPVGGRPIVAFPPFLLITYEVTILVGVILTVIGFFAACRFPVLAERPYAPEANVDKFALVFDDGAGDEIEQLLRDKGAESIRDVENVS